MLFSRDQMFYQILRSAAENALETASILIQLLEQPVRYAELGPAIKELESKGDRFTHDLFALVNKSFLTPLDKGDLCALGVGIDSVVDAMEAAAARIGIYKVTQSDRFLKAFGQTIRAQVAELVSAIDLLAGGKLGQIHDRAVHINFLENQGDETLRSGLSSLFEQAASDPVRFVTMKEIYETLEEATDEAEDVANLLEGVLMKRG
jgi:predicted phosphate transport protein (TIGR00153 family)